MQQSYISIIYPLVIVIILLLALWRIRIKKLASFNSPVSGRVEVVEKFNKERLLLIGPYPQGVSIHDKSIVGSYWYKVAELAVKHCRINPPTRESKILMLGLGSNTISNLIAKLDPKVHQTIIEYDPIIIKVCREYFDLDKLPKYKIILADAYEWVKESKDQFDVIIVDIYTGTPPFISIKSNEPPFIQNVLKLLKKDGLIIFNRPGHKPEVQDGSRNLQDYLKNYFKKTDLIDIKDPRGYRNNLVTGSGLIQSTQD